MIRSTPFVNRPAAPAPLILARAPVGALRAGSALLAAALVCAAAPAAVINFDSVPDGTVINTAFPGVAFSEPVSGGSIFARASGSARSAPNVVSVFATGNPAFRAFYGAVDASFAAPQRQVSIDVAAMRTPESLGTPQNKPYLQVFDASNNLLATLYFQGALPGAGGITAYETLRYTSTSANIARVRFSVQQSLPGPNVFGFFDNLSYTSTLTTTKSYDNFVNPRWTQTIEGTGVGVSQRNGRLEISLQAIAAGAQFLGRYESTCLLNGDFDLTVSYSLPSFQALSGVRLGLILPGGGHIERTTASTHDVFTPGDFYYSTVNGVGSSAVTTSDVSGHLRVARAGSTLRTYFYNAATAAWQLINSGTVPTTDLPFQLQAWSHDSVFDNKPVLVRFTNVNYTKARLVGAQCPTPTP